MPQAWPSWPDNEQRAERIAIDPARLERILVQAAVERHAVSYRQVLDMFGHRLGSGTVGNLCRILGAIDRARQEAGLPELACLVVREADRQPGAGYFSADDPQDPDARTALVAKRQAAAFAWAAGLNPSSAGRSRTRPSPGRSVPGHGR
ncbi:MAG TPA: hypothetical protein VHL31_25110 [Geminicoccus sp.]|jgi:hypothetical protein|uniref:hypothetical protein n=1 Tax=Geminicoccus sp. TaxID=2024832 RepID=UPI002E2F6097|nr:hypothetical protein [Geminicoccus sp.]HEX2529562.1 hypothetical protein [Geminicoccus sp.]